MREGKEREPGDLADFQTFPLPKATFLKALCKCVGPQLCYTAKNVQDGKLSWITSLLGPEPRGESRAGAGRWRRQRADWRKVWAFGIARSSRAKRAQVASTLWQASSQCRRVSVSAIYPGTHLPGYQRTPLEHADMSVKPKAFVLHTGLSLTLASGRGALVLI